MHLTWFEFILIMFTCCTAPYIIDKILKKVGEECTEVIIAGKADDKKETIYEIADLTYHLLVLMIQMGISLEDIHKELASRHVIDNKVKQEKMTK